jgi:hypothetical protein
MDVRDYRLHRTWGTIATMWVVPSAYTAIAAGSLAAGVTLQKADERVALLLSFVLFVGMAAFWWIRGLRTTYVIHVSPAGVAEFVSRIRRVKISFRDIVSIRPQGSYLGVLTLRHRNGSLRLLNQFTGFHVFLTDLQRANPNVELRGC